MLVYKTRRARAALLIGLALGASPALAAESPAAAVAPWPEKQYNPQPAAEDLTLPLPCGGAMTFRRVDAPSEGVLGDRRLRLGGDDDRFGYAEKSRADYVAGGFSDPAKAGAHYYYIGKYEVTAAQWASFGAACPAVGEQERLPVVKITWAEANSFAAQYASWLLKNAGEKLPKEDGAPGFVRLPTEAEWEYAARGGAVVSDSVFTDAAFPMPDGDVRYVWRQGTDSANNELNLVGLLKPNPLGLYDMLGNVGEFVLDPYRLNKLSRLHGQAGGHMVKGGDFRTPKDEVRSAARVEFAPIDKRGERRSDSTGLRLVLVPPSLPSAPRLSQIKSEWTALPSANAGAAAVQDDPVKEAKALAQSVDDPALKRRIDALSTVIQTSIQTRNEQRDRAALSALRVGAYVAQRLSEGRAQLTAQAKLLEGYKEDDPIRVGGKERLARSQKAQDDNLLYYNDMILGVAADYPGPVLRAQSDVLKRELEHRGVAPLAGRVDLFTAQILRVQAGEKLDRAKIMDDIK